MTMQEMASLYNAHSAAHSYILGFVHAHKLYSAKVSFNELSRYFTLCHASSKRGGFAKIRIRLTKAQRFELLGQAELLGDENLLTAAGLKNKGHGFEKIITEKLTSTNWKADSVPFWVQGDINVNGEEIQIKLDGAELSNEKTLARFTTAA